MVLYSFQSLWFCCIIIESVIFPWWVSRGTGRRWGCMFLKKGGMKKERGVGTLFRTMHLCYESFRNIFAKHYDWWLLAVACDSAEMWIWGQKQPSRGALKKRCSENMQQIYWRTPMPKCDFNKVALELVSCKFDAFFQNTFS